MAAVLLPVLAAGIIADLTRWKAIATLLVVLAIGGYFYLDSNDAFQMLYWRWTTPAMPPAEATFVAAANEMRVLRDDSGRGPDQVAALRQAESKVCALPADADNWVGRVTRKYLTGAGDAAALAIGIAPNIAVRTSNFNDTSGTLIRTRSPLFAQVSSLGQDDVVQFSGKIVGHAGACPNDPPIGENDKILGPEFLLHFDQVAKVAGH